MNLGAIGARIGASLVAAEFLGWDIKFAQESGPDQLVVLRHQFPQVPVFASSIPNINVEVFSIYCPGPPRHTGGRIPTMDSDYLELALQSIEFAASLSSRWVVLETNPRYVRSNRGADLAKVLASLGKFGYGFAYRILDSQYFGIPQARRSLFIVGYNGDWRPPAAVLFEQTSAREYFKEDRQKRFIARLPEELDTKIPFVLPYKVAHQTPLYTRVPRLPYLPEYGQPGQHIPFIFLYDGQVRHPSPTEVEKLQGFSEGYTATFFGKRRLSIICNSGCVPHYIWIFSRIEKVNEITN